MKRALLSLLVFGGPTLAAPAPGNSTMSGGTLPPSPEAAPPAVARDVGVAELPLLVTEPPEEPPAVDTPAHVTGGADSTFNPFAPLVLPEPGEAGSPARTGRPPAVTEPVPAAPAAPAAETAAAPSPPAPTPVPAPAPPARLGTATLPAALTARLHREPTRRSLSTGILERTLATKGETVSESAAVAAIRTPPSLTPAAVPGRGNRAALGPVTLMGLAGGEGPTGGNRVSRSLSDLRVAFSAMATGTGVFRIGDDAVPVLVAVGERLPGTNLVLSRLTASSAQFTEDDVRHTLLLNP